MARSSTEAEHRVVVFAVVEINWVTHLLHELCFPLSKTLNVYCDNVGVTYLCRNLAFHSHMKHFSIDFHFVRDQVEKNQIWIQHIHAAD